MAWASSTSECRFRRFGRPTFSAVGIHPRRMQRHHSGAARHTSLTGAMTFPNGVDVRHERFAPRNFSTRHVNMAPKPVSWPAPGGSSANYKLTIFAKSQPEAPTADVKQILTDIWLHLTGDTPAGRNAQQRPPPNTARRKLNHERFEFASATDSHRPQTCNTCRRTWWRNVANVCPSWRCEGSLRCCELGLEGITAPLIATLNQR